MNKLIFPLLITLFTLNTSTAQVRDNNREDKRDRVESLRIAFITRELNLSPDESTMFWPIYNEMRTKIENVKKETRRHIKSVDVTDDNKAKEVMLLKLDQKQKEVDLLRKYVLMLADKISPRKVMKLNDAETNFKKELLREMRNRKR